MLKKKLAIALLFTGVMSAPLVLPATSVPANSLLAPAVALAEETDFDNMPSVDAGGTFFMSPQLVPTDSLPSLVTGTTDLYLKPHVDTSDSSYSYGMGFSRLAYDLDTNSYDYDAPSNEQVIHEYDGTPWHLTFDRPLAFGEKLGSFTYRYKKGTEKPADYGAALAKKITNLGGTWVDGTVQVTFGDGGHLKEGYADKIPFYAPVPDFGETPKTRTFATYRDRILERVEADKGYDFTGLTLPNGDPIPDDASFITGYTVRANFKTNYELGEPLINEPQPDIDPKELMPDYELGEPLINEPQPDIDPKELMPDYELGEPLINEPQPDLDPSTLRPDTKPGSDTTSSLQLSLDEEQVDHYLHQPSPYVFPLNVLPATHGTTPSGTHEHTTVHATTATPGSLPKTADQGNALAATFGLAGASLLALARRLTRPLAR